MIIENECRKDEVYGINNLMCQQVWLHRGWDRIERFLEAYHHIRDSDVHDKLQTDLMEEWWKCNGEQSN
jgi:hypothetical protein